LTSLFSTDRHIAVTSVRFDSQREVLGITLSGRRKYVVKNVSLYKNIPLFLVLVKEHLLCLASIDLIL
jgi:hypothetical protein